ncbi:class I SAM-dependent methyltransferase [Thiohalorhabdus sp. Cl-TMA]|uniref:Class I SAM-dependent methyltransferase n=1 Tax=Thiohalorhabdus methylotrophus TaxID=3242694 RepID=A0ABV4TRQ0_9GAMM
MLDPRQPDPERTKAFVGQVVSDLGAAFSGVMTNLGHKLGLYRALADAGTLTPGQLAARTGTRERYVREWLSNQAAGGYLDYDPATGTYSLPEEHAAVLAVEDSPVFMAAAFDVASALWHDEDLIAEAFRTGNGIGWHQHHPRLFDGTAAFFRTGYRAHLTDSWIPALEGVEDKLRRGARVADVGCGYGISTILMAQTYPASHFYGFDYHAPSIQVARRNAEEAGVHQRTFFEELDAGQLPNREYDLICFMDCLHDLGDPLGAARRAREALAENGTVMLVEPFAGDSVTDNTNPVGRLFYAASTGFCTPHSLSQEGAAGLGAQAGEQRLRALLAEAGLRHFRRAAETPFNLVLETRP